MGEVIDSVPEAEDTWGRGMYCGMMKSQREGRQEKRTIGTSRQAQSKRFNISGFVLFES